MNVGNKKFNVNFFSIYDGHNGERTAEDLKTCLHKYILDDGAVLANPIANILYGFEKIENQLIFRNTGDEEKSGSCAICLIVIGII
jgi:hypothetical protein